MSASLRHIIFCMVGVQALCAGALAPGNYVRSSILPDRTLLQATGYYPSGTPYRLPQQFLSTAVDASTDRLHIANPWLSHLRLGVQSTGRNAL